jgi:hypothetical protein
MIWNNILKNQTQTKQLKKNLYSKKPCKTYDLGYEIEIKAYKKIEKNHKTNILKKKLMHNNKIIQSRIFNKLNVKG